MRALLAAGADADARDDRGYAPLHFAASRNAVGATRALLDAGADAHSQDMFGYTPLHYAAMMDAAEAAHALLEAGADAAARSWQNGMAPLDAAASNGSVAVLPLLVSRREVDINALCCDRQDDGGAAAGQYTPLLLAYWGGHSAAVHSLLELGADTEVAPAGKPPLLRAAAYIGDVWFARELLDHGADPLESFRALRHLR